MGQFTRLALASGVVTPTIEGVQPDFVDASLLLRGVCARVVPRVQNAHSADDQ